MKKSNCIVEHRKTFKTMTIYEQMLAHYDEQDRKAQLEVMQQIALAGLYRAGFFEKCTLWFFEVGKKTLIHGY